MNINIHIDINMNMDIIPTPSPPSPPPPRPRLRTAPAWGGGVWVRGDTALAKTEYTSIWTKHIGNTNREYQ